jgi:hypothetical protein
LSALPQSSSDTPSGGSAEAPEAFEPPELNDVQRRAVDSLRRDGIAILQFQDLLGEELWREAVADIAPFVREKEEAMADAGGQPAGKDDLIVRRFFDRARKDVPDARQTLSLAGPWLRIAAAEAALDIVNSYRGRWTWLYYVDNWFTVPYPGAEKRISSQRWHRDPEEEHVVKVFVYFSDVDTEAGPFEYICQSATGGRYGDLWPWSSEDRHPPPRELEAAIAPEHQLTLTGPRGTMIFCDTGGFHRGGFARRKARVLSAFTYVGSGRSKKKRRFNVDFAGRETTLPPQVRFALD